MRSSRFVTGDDHVTGTIHEWGYASQRNASNGPSPPTGDPRLDLIPVLDFGTGIAYHGTVPIVTAMYSDFVALVPQARAAASYVSGAHALKVGFTYLYNHAEVQNTDNNYGLRYIFFNGFPINVMQVAAPFTTHQRGSETRCSRRISAQFDF